jgi:hypothetical protein
MTCVIEELSPQLKVEKAPYKKRQKPCLVCGKPSAGVTSYVFMADGTNKIGVPFCQLHLDNQQAYATPVFENQDALDLFKKEHPGLFKHSVQGKTILFLQPPKTDADSLV